MFGRVRAYLVNTGEFAMRRPTDTRAVVEEVGGSVQMCTSRGVIIARYSAHARVHT